MARRRQEDYEDTDEYRSLQQALGKRIRRLRMARGISQRNFAELAGISYTNYAMIEAGAANVTVLLLDRIAKSMGVSITSLFEDTPAENTTGIEGLMVRLLAELDRVRIHFDVRRDEMGRITEELQAFIDANHDALAALATTGKLSPLDRK